MAPAPRVKIIIPDVTDEMRSAVEAYAQEHDLSRNQVAVSALEARYKLKPSEVDGSGYRPQENGRSGPWSLEVPVKVRDKLRMEAARGFTISGLVRATLADLLGLPVEDARRKPRRRRGD
jgi:hypothetical protein